MNTLARQIAQGGREDGQGTLSFAASTEGAGLSSLLPNFLTSLLSSISVRYFACDHLGTPRLVMDEQANVLEYRDFEPFGVELALFTPAIAPSRFTLHERDEASSYDYMHFRFYASSVGQFLKPDPPVPIYLRQSPGAKLLSRAGRFAG